MNSSTTFTPTVFTTAIAAATRAPSMHNSQPWRFRVHPDAIELYLDRHRVPVVAVRLPARAPDRTIRLELTGGMMAYDWGFNGRRYDPKRIEPVGAGERVRVEFVNTTTMWHPVHLHGHTFAVGDTGIRKDTAIVLPGQTLPVVLDADNPGLWMVHCHNIYHAEAGMMTLIGYQK